MSEIVRSHDGSTGQAMGGGSTRQAIGGGRSSRSTHKARVPRTHHLPFRALLRVFTRKRGKDEGRISDLNSSGREGGSNIGKVANKTPHGSGQTTAGSSGLTSDGESRRTLGAVLESPILCDNSQSHFMGGSQQPLQVAVGPPSQFSTVDGQCLSQFYESPASSVKGVGTAGGDDALDRVAGVAAEVGDGGVRVQHLLRTSQLHGAHHKASSKAALATVASDSDELSVRFSSGDTSHNKEVGVIVARTSLKRTMMRKE